MFSPKKVFKHLWPSMRPYRMGLLAITIIFTIRISLDIIRPLVFKKIIDALTTVGVDRISISHHVYLLIGILTGLYGFSVLVGRMSKYLHLSFEINVIKRLRDYTFNKIESQSQSFFSNTFAGSLVTKSRRFVGSFENMFDILIYDFLSTTVVLVGVFIVLAGESALICVFFFVWICLFVAIVAFFVRRKIRFDLAEAATDSKIGGRLADVFGNNIAVKTFSAHPREMEDFEEITDHAAAASRKAWFYSNKIDALQGTLNFFVQGIVFFSLIYLWLHDRISTGTVVLVQLYMTMVFDKLWGFGNAFTRFMKSAADMNEMVDIFEIPIDVKDDVRPEKVRMTEGRIVFSDVGFEYSEGRTIFKNFNMDIRPGERVGLVGHSGAGKSTITKLLLRFTDVTSGAIMVDGQDIRRVSQDDLRRVISYVPQEPVLFHRSLRENIAYGRPDATHEEVVEASRRAHADEFIEKLDMGYETLVGERGVKLSGGERQRVAIARAILKNSPVLVLDEATSSLDSHSEALIQEAFDELMKNKTTIVIAHRLSTIQKMDRIIVLEDGCVAEEGTHTDLLKNKDGIYKKMWDLQAGGFIDEGDDSIAGV